MSAESDNPTEVPSAEAQSADRLAALETTFLAALAHKEANDFDKAEEKLREILRTEPRLAEPHLELARILLDTDRLPDAEDHARQALELLSQPHGQWIDDLPENVVLALAHAVLAETLRRRADEDDVLFGDPATFKALVAEAKSHFDQAAELDPQDEYSSYYAFFLGIEDGTGQPAQLELSPAKPDGEPES
ncbi:MAG: tetratricopeptide repeat protein [Myxococcota bacterium]